MKTLHQAFQKLHPPFIPRGFAEQTGVSLDIAELVVHDHTNIRRSCDILPEKRRVVREGLCLDGSNHLPTLGDVRLEFAAGMLIQLKHRDGAKSGSHAIIKGDRSCLWDILPRGSSQPLGGTSGGSRVPSLRSCKLHEMDVRHVEEVLKLKRLNVILLRSWLILLFGLLGVRGDVQGINSLLQGGCTRSRCRAWFFDRSGGCFEW